MHRATVWQHSSNSNINIVQQLYWAFLVESVWFLFWWCPLLSVDCLHKFCLSSTPSENSQAGRDLGNRMAGVIGLTRNESIPWEAMPEVFKCSVREMTWRLISWTEHSPHFSNRTLEYLRHNFPWDRLILRQTNNPCHPVPKISTRLTIFWGGTWKTEFVKTIHRQERTLSEEKSERFHKKCSIELWKMLMFELLLCCHTAVQCMEQT